MKPLLAAVDNSRYADSVIERAAELVRLFSADLVLLSVIDSDPMRTTTIGDSAKNLRELHRRLVAKYFPKKEFTVENEAPGSVTYRDNNGMRIRSVILQGSPVDEICQFAAKIDSSLVLVGNRGLGNVGTAILGSVSEKVVRKCSTSVLVVKSKGSSDSSDWESSGRHQLRTG